MLLDYYFLLCLWNDSEQFLLSIKAQLYTHNIIVEFLYCRKLMEKNPP